MTTETTVSDAERIALTIAHDAHVDHPVLKAWRDGMMIDPSYHGFIESVDITPELQASCDAVGCASGPELGMLFINRQAHPRIEEEVYLLPGETATPQQHASAVERISEETALYHLLNAVILHRRRGRPQGNVETDLWGVGGPVARVSTSLAAAVVEYHEAIRNAILEELHALKTHMRIAARS